MSSFYDAHPVAFWIMFVIAALSFASGRPFKGFSIIQVQYRRDKKDKDDPK